MNRLGDKRLAFKACDNCGAENVSLYVIKGEILCEGCA